MQNLIFILGPTGVGKTNWAIQWAEQSPSCMINSDSIQAYKELNIGSAKPDWTNYPFMKFYLFEEVSAPHIWTAGDFRRKALHILKKELPEKKVFIVGGSGFYIQALEKGMYPVHKPKPFEEGMTSIQNSKPLEKEVPPSTSPKSPENQWEKWEAEKGLSYLYDLLKKQDPETAEQISPKDRYRILRALSLIELEGKPVSQIKKEFKEQKLPYPYLKVGLKISKEELLQKIKKRSENMLKRGLVEEVETLLKKGLKGWRPLNSVGYKEVQLYLEGKIQKKDLLERIVSSSMSLAKKQKTWFKKDKSIKWYDHKTKALEVYKELFQ